MTSRDADGVLAAVSIESAPLDAEALEQLVRSHADGALVTFRGIIRDHDGGHAVVRLEYSAHPGATESLRAACQRVMEATGVTLAAQHRIGTLEVGDIALVAVAASPHRAEAFAACAALVDDIKSTVPIWKRQHHPDGTAEWLGL